MYFILENYRYFNGVFSNRSEALIPTPSQYYPWYYTRLEDKSSDVVTIMDYYLKHVEHRKIEDSSKSQVCCFYGVIECLKLVKE